MFLQPCHCIIRQVNVRCLAQQFVSRCCCHKSCPSCRICVKNCSSIHHFLLHSFSTDYTVTSSELASWAMHCTTIRRVGRSPKVSMWWLSRPHCQVENCWSSTDLSHSNGKPLSPEIRVKEVSPALDVSLHPARSATRRRRRSALFPSDTLFAPSKSRLEIAQVNGISARCSVWAGSHGRLRLLWRDSLASTAALNTGGQNSHHGAVVGQTKLQ